MTSLGRPGKLISDSIRRCRSSSGACAQSETPDMAANAARTPRDPLWYKDSTIYQLHVKSFCDSDGDGIGDFRGALQKIDYIADLGVDAIWLLPFYPSPRRDDGYDIADYRGVHPDYGTMADLRAFIDAAHVRGMKIITELVINHTSDQHPWFKRAPGSQARQCRAKLLCLVGHGSDLRRHADHLHRYREI